MKEKIKTILSGIAMGVCSAIPGVSAGTIAVILGVYEKIVWAISNLFKEFKKSFLILLLVIIGLVIGILPTLYVVDKTLTTFLFGLVCIFAGFIIGSIPSITKEISNVKPTTSYIVVGVIAFIIVVLLGVGSVLLKVDNDSFFVNPQWWCYLLLISVGFISASALVVPGISGGTILILLGFYSPLITYTMEKLKNALQGDFAGLGTQIGLLACFGVGVIAGFFIISNIMNVLLKKHKAITFYGIIGFIFGSIITLFINNDIWEYYQVWANGSNGVLKKEVEIPLGIVLLLIAAIASYLLTKKKKTN